MKFYKIVLLFLVMVGGSYSWAADDTLSMVTFFPVPYSAYNNVFVSKQLDVGTSTSTFTLDLGNPSASSTSPSLLADLVFLDDDGSSHNSSLSFSMPVLFSKKATFGYTNQEDFTEALLDFQNVRIANIPNTVPGTPVNSISANNMTVQQNFFLFPDHVSNSALPLSCDDSVSWSTLDFGGEKSFLTCGETLCKTVAFQQLSNYYITEYYPGGPVNSNLHLTHLSTFSYSDIGIQDYYASRAGETLGGRHTATPCPSVQGKMAGSIDRWPCVGAGSRPCSSNGKVYTTGIGTIPTDLGNIDCFEEFPDASVTAINACYSCIAVKDLAAPDNTKPYLNYYLTVQCSFNPPAPC